MIRIAIKTLTSNDLGLTGSHQAGFLVPKDLARSGFFPTLNVYEKNPREVITFSCEQQEETFSFIYYNTKPLGLGTRDEYRVTGLSSFYKKHNCQLGDQLKFIYDDIKQTYELIIMPIQEKQAMTHFDVMNRPLIINAGWAY